MIRPATFDDIPRILELGAQLHAESPRYRDEPFLPAKVDGLMRSLIDSSTGVIFVAEREGVVVGGIAGMVVPQWFNDNLYGFDLSFFVEVASRGGAGHAWKLLLAFKAWCTAKGARHIDIGITTGIQLEATTRMYERMGFRKTGHLFRMEL